MFILKWGINNQTSTNLSSYRFHSMALVTEYKQLRHKSSMNLSTSNQIRNSDSSLKDETHINLPSYNKRVASAAESRFLENCIHWRFFLVTFFPSHKNSGVESSINFIPQPFCFGGIVYLSVTLSVGNVTEQEHTRINLDTLKFCSITLCPVTVLLSHTWIGFVDPMSSEKRKRNKEKGQRD